MVKPGFNPISIPCQKGQDVKRGLLAKLLAVAGVTEHEYLAAFNRK
jgi:hypothetical protein